MSEGKNRDVKLTPESEMSFELPPLRTFIVRKYGPSEVDLQEEVVEAHILQHSAPATVEFAIIMGAEKSSGRPYTQTIRLFFNVEEVIDKSFRDAMNRILS
jgi:hypothetical protein